MSYRIVVADKDPRSREAVTRFLFSENNEFVSVSNSGELKQAIKSKKPDLIILNSVLADAPGWKLVPRIKDSREYSDVPVLLMTGDPGSPPPGQIQATGADKYVTKPLDGRALKEAVQSLLGIGSAAEDTALSEEIMIDFADEDSGDMTEELLQMSNVALDHDDHHPDVGDTVEIDTGTLVAELDHHDEPTGEETYEDTVRLNLDDMGLDDDLDGGSSFEPTIELISDIPVDSPADELIAATEPEPRLEEPLPDFSTETGHTRDADAQTKDSVTIDMDAEDMGLELDFDEFEDDSASMQEETIDVDDTEIGQILEVQEPSQVLTSDDLALEDDSVVKEGVTGTLGTGVEVIDLEEDAELKEIDLEELEPVEEEPLGLGLDASLKPQEEELQLTAVETLQGGIAEDEDVSLDLESPLELATGYDDGEELTLDEGAIEELTTQEFFGEELPTQEFPTEKFPVDNTTDLGIEDEIVLEDLDFEGEYVPETKQLTAEVPTDDITIDVESAEQMLFREGREDEPVLEVTEDIAFDEIMLPDIVETPPEEPKATVVEPPAAVPQEVPLVELPKPAPAVAIVAPEVPAAAPPVVAAVLEPPAPEPVKPEIPKAPEAPAPPPPQPIPPAAAPAGVSHQEIASIISTSLGSLLHQAMPGKSQFADTVDTALKGSLPTKHELSDTYSQTLQASLPSKEEILHALTKEMVSMMPTHEAVSARVDEMVAKAIPSGEAIAEKVDHAIKGALPSSDAILERLTQAFHAGPWTQEVTAQVEKALTALPTSEAIHGRLTEALERIPPQEEIRTRIDKALEVLPNAEAVKEHLDKAFRDLPTRAEIEAKVEASLAGISTDQVMSRVEDALKALPTREEIESRVDASLAGISADQVMTRLEGALKDLPAREEIESRVEASLAGISADAMLSRMDGVLKDLPTRAEIEAKVEASLAGISADQVMSRLEDALKALPIREEIESRVDASLAGISADRVMTRMEDALKDLPTREEIESRVDASLAGISADAMLSRVDGVLKDLPTRSEIEARVDASLSGISADQVMSRLEGALKHLPTREEIESKVDASLAGISADRVMSRVEIALGTLPTSEDMMAQLDKSLSALPSAAAILSRVEDRLAASMPDRETVNIAMQDMFSDKISSAFSEAEIRSTLLGILPTTDEILETMHRALPERERLQETITQSLTMAIGNSLPERVWLETVSRGLFDERTRGALPKKDEIVAMLRQEIRGKLLDAVEKAVKEQIEKITSEFTA